jgi:Asp-tRNA(Asn)/Glu-tRNA(Gln) amidotransferase C subunit
MIDRVGPEQVRALAAAAGLPISEGRAQELAGAVQALLADCRKLDAVDVSAVEAPVVFPHA